MKIDRNSLHPDDDFFVARSPYKLSVIKHININLRPDKF